jgi:CO/xanthine dehydrogenase FAD-binding subunit
MAIFYRRLPRFDYIVPKTLDEALKALNEHKGSAKLLAGGTDLVPQLKKRELKTPGYVIDLKGISGLDGISYDAQGLQIGPLATISSIAQSPEVQERYPMLVQAALGMASPQVRNRGTFAGNICNAVPSADSAPSLLALNATIMIKSIRGERTSSIDQFFTGPRKTMLEADEMLVGITVPKPLPASRGVYLKLSPRHSMDLAIVGVAAVGISENGVCKDIRIALGAVAPTPIRAPMAEAILQGKPITSALINEAAKNAITQCSPIDDHRASQEYRCDMIYVLTKRALNQILLPQEG